MSWTENRLKQFQLTRLREARHRLDHLVDEDKQFQLTRLREARPWSCSLWDILPMFQLTRLREARRRRGEGTQGQFCFN